MSTKGITARSQSYSKWYLDIIERGELAENSSVKGCMVIKPYGYAIWEKIQRELDNRIKAMGVSNAYFPLFIPLSFFSKEAAHVKGFAKECAVVTHYRLKETADGTGVEVDPQAKLEEELIVRPTSETVMYDTFSRWITSWRDLPLKVNQWANIVRWEKRTRPFLRTTEFLWQEGHTAHESHKECQEQALQALNMYRDFAKEVLAIDAYCGEKSDSEKFAGALNTYGVEAMMQDGKALQLGTSHDLGQNFSKVFNIKYTNRKGDLEYVWQTSWGVSTRIIGAVVMTHSDDRGLVLPPVIAPIKVVVIPIYKEQSKGKVLEFAKDIQGKISAVVDGVHMDMREHVSVGFKFNEWEKKGVPIRVEVGESDLEKNTITIVRRDSNERSELSINSVGSEINILLENIQSNLLKRSTDMLSKGTYTVSSFEEFKNQLKTKKAFIKAYWCGSKECEDNIKYESKATTRCLSKEGKGKCIYCNKESNHEWVFAISY